MKLSGLVGLALASSAVASPVTKRQSAITDVEILNYALTLEHLENRFYADAVARFSQADFEAAGFLPVVYWNVVELAYDEKTHVDFLTSALTAAGAPATAECTYNFGYTDVKSFLAVASILEGVGVSAYLGAAASIQEPAYLTAAGSILTVEARHSAYVRAQLNQFPYPQAFDAPLSFNNVFSLAALFITGCPQSNPPLPVKAFPTLTVTNTNTLYSLSSVQVKSAVTDYSGPLFAAFVTVTGPVWASIAPLSEPGTYDLVIPNGVHGQSYLVLTSDNTGVTDANTIAGPAVVMIENTDGKP